MSNRRESNRICTYCVARGVTVLVAALASCSPDLEGDDSDDAERSPAVLATQQGLAAGDTLVTTCFQWSIYRKPSGTFYAPGWTGNLIIGTSNTETLNGTSGPDLIFGGVNGQGVGRDTIRGNEGDDYLCGSSGFDEIHGGKGNDHIDGMEGGDRLYGEVGSDTIVGGAGAYQDFLFGGPDNDTLNGNDGDDGVYGEAGNDTVRGGKGEDNLTGGAGDDKLYGDKDFDWLDGGDGTADYCYGEQDPSDLPVQLDCTTLCEFSTGRTCA